MLTRRDFGFGLASVAFGGLALSGCAKLRDYAARLPGLRVGEMATLPRQPRLERGVLPGLLDLRGDLEVSVISSRDARLGPRRTTMHDGFRIPDHADGMGAFRLRPGDDDWVVLIRNHELKRKHKQRGPGRGTGNVAINLPPERRDGEGDPLPGGTTRIVYNCVTGEVASETLTLTGTLTNCAGGATPWGSWLTCEENVSPDHGYVYEVPAMQEGLEPAPGHDRPVPLTQMGRFNHEAAAVDPRTGIVYMTEDRRDGLFYRFIPRTAGRLADGGRLQALAFVGELEADARNWTANRWRECVPREVRWIGLDEHDVTSPRDNLRHLGHENGAVRFACGEGIHFGEDEIYFCCTSGGRIRSGQVMRYRRSAYEGEAGEESNGSRPTLEIFLEVTDPGVLNYVDNLNVAPNGHLIACEDTYVAGEDGFYLARPIAEELGGSPTCYLRGITERGEVYDIARLHGATELAGVCFSPDGQLLFVNHYSPATTLAIRAKPGFQAPWLPRVGGWQLYDASATDWRPAPSPHPSKAGQRDPRCPGAPSATV